MLQVLIFLVSFLQANSGFSPNEKKLFSNRSNSITTYFDTIPDFKESYSEKLDWSNIEKAQVSLKDSLIWIFGNIKKDYRIYGYAQPSNSAKCLILFSVFTSEVEGNPYNCLFGAFYSTGDLSIKGKRLKFRKKFRRFIEAELISNDSVEATMYFEKKWIEFSK